MMILLLPVLLPETATTTTTDIRVRPAVQGVCEEEEGRGGGCSTGAEAAGAGIVYSCCTYLTIVQCLHICYITVVNTVLE